MYKTRLKILSHKRLLLSRALVNYNKAKIKSSKNKDIFNIYIGNNKLKISLDTLKKISYINLFKFTINNFRLYLTKKNIKTLFLNSLIFRIMFIIIALICPDLTYILISTIFIINFIVIPYSKCKSSGKIFFYIFLNCFLKLLFIISM